MSPATSPLVALANRLRWELRRGWGALDNTMLVAAALLVFWLGVTLTVNAPLEQDAQALAQEAGRLQRQSGMRPVKVQRAATSKALVAFFPAAAEREAQLQRMQALAAKEGLQLERADYRSEPVRNLALQGFTVRLTLKGSYGQQRQFLHTLLAELPNLAVTRISLERAAVGPDAMSAVLEARLYYRSDDLRSAQR